MMKINSSDGKVFVMTSPLWENSSSVIEVLFLFATQSAPILARTRSHLFEILQNVFSRASAVFPFLFSFCFVFGKKKQCLCAVIFFPRRIFIFRTEVRFLFLNFFFSFNIAAWKHSSFICFHFPHSRRHLDLTCAAVSRVSFIPLLTIYLRLKYRQKFNQKESGKINRVQNVFFPF